MLKYLFLYFFRREKQEQEIAKRLEEEKRRQEKLIRIIRIIFSLFVPFTVIIVSNLYTNTNFPCERINIMHFVTTVIAFKPPFPSMQLK